VDEEKLKGFRPYQVQGVQFLEGRGGTGLVGDEMGLGKTIQAIGYFIMHPEIRPVAVVAPAGAKINWAREIKKWAGDESAILYGRNPGHLPAAPWYIINYDIQGTQRIDNYKETLYIKLKKFYE
jgi:SNF2 family DNA or RNA helicase